MTAYRPGLALQSDDEVDDTDAVRAAVGVVPEEPELSVGTGPGEPTIEERQAAEQVVQLVEAAVNVAYNERVHGFNPNISAWGAHRSGRAVEAGRCLPVSQASTRGVVALLRVNPGSFQNGMSQVPGDVVERRSFLHQARAGVVSQLVVSAVTAGQNFNGAHA